MEVFLFMDPEFQSTLPVGGATYFRLRNLLSINFNPRSPWGERHRSRDLSTRNLYFNPRSPWGERRCTKSHGKARPEFQSTLPVGGATLWLERLFIQPLSFQSTLPVGGATSGCQRYLQYPRYFNPRSPWGERQYSQSIQQ